MEIAAVEHVVFALNKTVLFLLFFAFNIESVEFSSTIGYSSNKNTQALLGYNQNSDSSSSNLNLSSSFSLTDNIDASIGTTFFNNDYSEFTLRDSDNKEFPLDFDGIEQNISSGLIFTAANYIASLSGETTISDSPFKTSFFNTNHSISFFNQSTILDFGFTFSRANKPETYFLNYDFKPKKRPTTEYGKHYKFSISQVLNSQLKSKLAINALQNNQTRPWHFGADFTQYIAINSALFANVTASYYQDQNIQPDDDRGIFKSFAVRNEIQYELLYDFFLKGAYSIIIEKENNKKLDLNRQIGGDKYELGLSYALTSGNINLNLAYLNTNTRASSFSSTAQLSWEF